MALTVKVHTERVAAAAEDLQAAARRYDITFRETFAAWADRVAEVMWEEIPKDTHETADSVTVEHRSRSGQNVARVGPTNRDDRGRPVGFYLNYGAAGRSPADFIGSTARRVADVDLDVGSVL